MVSKPYILYSDPVMCNESIGDLRKQRKILGTFSWTSDTAQYKNWVLNLQGYSKRRWQYKIYIIKHSMQHMYCILYAIQILNYICHWKNFCIKKCTTPMNIVKNV